MAMPTLNTNPYQAVRGQLNRAARRQLSNALLQRMARKPVRPDEVINLDRHLLDLNTPDGTIRMICVTRLLPGHRDPICEISIRVHRGGVAQEASDGVTVEGELWTPPTWFEITLIRALAWPDAVEVVVVMAPGGDFRHLDSGAVHLRGPAPVRRHPAGL